MLQIELKLWRFPYFDRFWWPSWTPSWISKIAQGLQLHIILDIFIYILMKYNQQRKKLLQRLEFRVKYAFFHCQTIILHIPLEYLSFLVSLIVTVTYLLLYNDWWLGLWFLLNNDGRLLWGRFFHVHWCGLCLPDHNLLLLWLSGLSLLYKIGKNQSEMNT